MTRIERKGIAFLSKSYCANLSMKRFNPISMSWQEKSPQPVLKYKGTLLSSVHPLGEKVQTVKLPFYTLWPVQKRFYPGESFLSTPFDQCRKDFILSEWTWQEKNPQPVLRYRGTLHSAVHPLGEQYREMVISYNIHATSPYKQFMYSWPNVYICFIRGRGGSLIAGNLSSSPHSGEGGGEYDHHSLACHIPPIPPLIVRSSIGNSIIILNGETRREKKEGAHLHVPPYSI